MTATKLFRSLKANMDQEPSMINQVKKAIYNQRADSKRKSSQPPLRRSNFFLTINSNRSNRTMSPAAFTEFYNFFESMIKNLMDNDIHDFIILKPSTEDDGKLKGVPLHERVKGSIQFAIEIGPERGLLHSHAVLVTQHRGVNLKLDYDGLHSYLEKKLDGIYHLYVKLFRDNFVSLQDYISKTAGDRRSKF